MLITALQLRLTLFKNDEVDLWVSDHSVGASEVVARLQRENLFNEVRYVKTKKEFYTHGWQRPATDLLKFNLGRYELDISRKYDEIVFYNLSLLEYAIADALASGGCRPRFSILDEGLFSYNVTPPLGRMIQASNILRRCNGRPIVSNLIENYYCFLPEIRRRSMPYANIKIPSLDETREEITPILNRIFDYAPSTISQKYVFFASSSDVDGKPVGESRLAGLLVDEVGAENILVKVHPRDNRGFYEGLGLPTMKKSFVPWEVLYLNGAASGKTLLSVTSGSFVGISAMVESDTKGFFLRPERFEKNEEENYANKIENIKDVINRLHSRDLCLNVKFFNKGIGGLRAE